MKNNTEETKLYIAEALRRLPDDFALAPVRQSLTKAYNELTHVEEKRARRSQQQPTRKQPGVARVAEQRTAPTSQQAPQWTPEQVLGVVNYIDQQILEAKQELAEIQKQRQRRDAPQEFRTEVGPDLLQD